MKNKIILTLLAVIIAMGLFIGGFMIGGKDSGKKIDASVIESTLNDISEMSTVEYNYTNMALMENHKEFYGWTLPFTTSKFIITYDGSIKAGIDFSKVTIDVNENTITVTLPDAKILSHTIDYDSLQVMDEKYSVFNKITIDDYNSFYADQSKAMEQKAIEKGLLAEAKVNAQAIIRTAILEVAGDTYTVVFK